MKFLVLNYSCLQNPWLRGYRPPDPRPLCPLSSTEFVEPPPTKKIPGYATDHWSGGTASHPAPKNSECKNPLEKVLASIFYDQNGILLIDYLPKGQTINAQHYSSLLVQLKDILKEKRRGKINKVVLFLHDNTPAHRTLATQKKLAYLGFQFLDHPPYSPDLALSDYHLFPGLKEQLKSHHFSSEVGVIAAAETWLDGQHS